MAKDKVTRYLHKMLHICFLTGMLAIFSVTLFPESLALLDIEKVELTENSEKESAEENKESEKDTEKDDFIHKYFHAGFSNQESKKIVARKIYSLSSLALSSPPPPPKQV